MFSGTQSSNVSSPVKRRKLQNSFLPQALVERYPYRIIVLKISSFDLQTKFEVHEMIIFSVLISKQSPSNVLNFAL